MHITEIRAFFYISCFTTPTPSPPSTDHCVLVLFTDLKQFLGRDNPTPRHPQRCSFPLSLLHLTPIQTGKRLWLYNSMDLTIKGWNGVKHTVELGEDDTSAVMRRKVASAVGLPEDGFVMSFRGELMDEGYDVTQLSAGDTVVLAKAKKYDAIAALHALGETDITSKKLKSVQDPEVACLLLQAEVATVIPSHFLAGTSLTSLDLSAESVVTHIGNSFLSRCISLTSIDLSGLIHLTQIGQGFLFGCSALCSVDLTPLSNVTQIDGYFLAGCTALCSLDLTPLRSVTQVGDYFLAGCSALRSLDLTPLSNVTQIGSDFLNGCIALCSLDLAPQRSVTQIGNNTQSIGFLFGCTSLRNINISGCNEVVLGEAMRI